MVDRLILTCDTCLRAAGGDASTAHSAGGIFEHECEQPKYNPKGCQCACRNKGMKGYHDPLGK